MTDPLFGIRIQCSPLLAGCNKAVQMGDGPILLSPAMYDLVTHAEGDELRKLLGAIRILRIPKMDFSLPITTVTRPHESHFTRIHPCPPPHIPPPETSGKRG